MAVHPPARGAQRRTAAAPERGGAPANAIAVGLEIILHFKPQKCYCRATSKTCYCYDIRETSTYTPALLIYVETRQQHVLQEVSLILEANYFSTAVIKLILMSSS